MTVLKSHGKVFGAHLTNAEQKALDIEIDKAMAAHLRKSELEIDAMVLWVLQEEFGFDEDQLHQMFRSFNKQLDRLIAHYEMEETDLRWLCSKMLKESGIDLDAWYKEEESS